MKTSWAINGFPSQVATFLTPGTELLLVNTDPVNTVWYDDSVSVNSITSTPIGPQGSLGITKKGDLFFITAGPAVTVLAIPGGTSWTPPPSETQVTVTVNAAPIDWIDITKSPYNCDPSGSKDASAGFLKAQNASVAGGGIPIYAPTNPGEFFWFNSTAIAWLPGQGPIQGSWCADPFDYGDTYGTIFKLGPAYAGTSFLGLTTTLTSFVPGPRMYNIAVDGSGAPSGCNGMVILGHVSDGDLENVEYSQFPGVGYIFGSNAGENPLTWRFGRNVRARQCAGGGWQINALTDSEGSIIARGCGGTTIDGVIIGFCANSRFWVRSEFSGKNGVECQSQGGYTLHVSTDRNAQSGVAVTGAGPFSGSQPIILYCDDLRRDASSGSGSGLAIVGAVTPVIVRSLNVYTGVNDGGGGLNSPDKGLTLQNWNYVELPRGAMVQANTTPLNILGSTGTGYLDMDESAILTATGTNSSSPGGAGAPAFTPTWHTLTAANFANGWTITGYARWRQLGRHIEFDFQQLTSANPVPADGTTMINAGVLPARMDPAQSLGPIGGMWTTASDAQGALKYQASGELDFYSTIGGTGSAFNFSGCIRFPLD